MGALTGKSYGSGSSRGPLQAGRTVPSAHDIDTANTLVNGVLGEVEDPNYVPHRGPRRASHYRDHNEARRSHILSNRSRHANPDLPQTSRDI